MSKLKFILIFIILPIAYLISPFDLLPDFLGLPGRLDDLAVIIYIIYKYRQLKKKDAQFERLRGAGQSEAKDEKAEERRSAYEILEVSPDATEKEITAKYRELTAKYHPDKVNHLGEDLQKAAHEKLLEIQKAYEELK